MEKLMKKIYKQFVRSGHDEVKWLFVCNSGNGWSEYKDGPNLFGWDDNARQTKYTNTFRLELIYEN